MRSRFAPVVQPPHAVPPLWALKAQRGELPPVLTKLMRPSFDRALTGGRTSLITRDEVFDDS